MNNVSTSLSPQPPTQIPHMTSFPNSFIYLIIVAVCIYNLRNLSRTGCVYMYPRLTTWDAYTYAGAHP